MKEKNLPEYSPDSDPRPLIPEGNYEAVCIKCEVKKYLAKGKKLYLHYQIINSEYAGTVLFEPINYNYKSFSSATKYYTEWTVASGRRPQRRDKMSHSVFKDRAFLVKVKTAKPKYNDGAFKPDTLHYSIVDRIVEVYT